MHVYVVQVRKNGVRACGECQIQTVAHVHSSGRKEEERRNEMELYSVSFGPGTLAIYRALPGVPDNCNQAKKRCRERMCASGEHARV